MENKESNAKEIPINEIFLPKKPSNKVYKIGFTFESNEVSSFMKGFIIALLICIPFWVVVYYSFIKH